MPTMQPTENMSVESRGSRMPDPCALIIFGATGNLTQRKLIPALFKLWQNKLLPKIFSIVGIARKPLTDEDFRKTTLEGIKNYADIDVDSSQWASFAQSLFYVSINAEELQAYESLSARLDALDQERNTGGNRLFYLAVPPQEYVPIVKNLGEAGLARYKSKKSWIRIIIEKPFGRDLESARELNRSVTRYYHEDQIYRIDHYLGKETVQNILVFRFANSIFEPIWNRQYIDHVQIMAAEEIGIENRGRYYDTAGALRDMVQNHLLQLVCTTAMEPPSSFTATAVRDEKAKVLQAIRPITAQYSSECTVRGQYTDGSVCGESVPAYRKEQMIAPNSQTETYVALKFLIDNWRWAEVPFYLRTGKRLAKRVTEIAIQFKRTPHLVFARTPEEHVLPNLLALGIQPDENIQIQFEAKVPGPLIRLRPVDMDFKYSTSFSIPTEEAYERLLLDAWLGDATLFARSDWIELAWSFITPILEGWENLHEPIPTYAAGAWGPAEADAFMARDNRKWRLSSKWTD